MITITDGAIEQIRQMQGDIERLRGMVEILRVQRDELISQLGKAHACLRQIIEADDEFRMTLPDDWEGDPIRDAVAAAKYLMESSSAVERFAVNEDVAGSKPASPAIDWKKVEQSLNENAIYWGRKSVVQAGPTIAAILIALRDALRAGSESSNPDDYRGPEFEPPGELDEQGFPVTSAKGTS